MQIFKPFPDPQVENPWIRLIKRNCNLMEAWIVVEDISYRRLELFGNSYLAFKHQRLDSFISFILSCRENLNILRSFHESLFPKLHDASSCSTVHQVIYCRLLMAHNLKLNLLSLISLIPIC